MMANADHCLLVHLKTEGKTIFEGATFQYVQHTEAILTFSVRSSFPELAEKQYKTKSSPTQ